MKYFVDKESVVRKIWGSSDTILFIFAGAAAEFALNKAVDWLYFTGRLPSDPLARLFSTVSYARMIVFAEDEKAKQTILNMKNIHRAVEENRRSVIPDWAYRDVLFMLVHYSIASYELLQHKLSESEKEEVYQVFYKVGSGMDVKGLPSCHAQWEIMYHEHLEKDLERTAYTEDLFKQYRKHLGALRYWLLKQAQKVVVPARVNKLLGYGKLSVIKIFLPVFKILRKLKIDWYIKSLFLPAGYRSRIKNLDLIPGY